MTVVQGLVASSSRFGVGVRRLAGNALGGWQRMGPIGLIGPIGLSGRGRQRALLRPNAERQTLIHLYRRSFTVVGAALGGLFFSERCDSQIPDLLVELMKPRFREERG